MSTPEASGLRLELWHVGTVVRDIEESIADHAALGATAWSPVARLETRSFDCEAGEVADEVLDVAWVRLGAGRGTVELISPVGGKATGPQSRLLAQRPGPSHLAYWCEDFVTAAQAMLDRGAEMVIAVLADPSAWDGRLPAQGPPGLLPMCSTCYLRLPSGLIVELNPVGSRQTLHLMWGPDVLSVLPEPAILV